MRVDEHSSITQDPTVSQFIDGSNAGDDYAYDAVGNLTRDANQGVTNITYNHFNKPTQIEMAGGRTLLYVYAADGTKLRQYVRAPDYSIEKQTDYVGPIVYEDPDGIPNSGCQGCQDWGWTKMLRRLFKKSSQDTEPWALVQDSSFFVGFPHPWRATLQRTLRCYLDILSNEPLTLAYTSNAEGRARRAGNELVFEYYLRDHLGNTRVTFGDNDGNGVPEVLQEDHYYPFGLKMSDGALQAAARNVHLYNGKELRACPERNEGTS